MRRQLQPIITIWWRDLTALIRDRSAIMVGVVVPAVLIWVLSLTLGATAQNRPIGVVSDESAPATALVEGPMASLVDQEVISITTYPDRAALVAAIENEEVEAGLVAESSSLEVVSGPDSMITSMILGSIAESAASVNDGVAAVIATRVSAGLDVGNPGEIARQLATTPTITVIDSSAQAGGISTTTQMAAGMASFFLFFTVQFGVISLLEGRRNGTLARILAAPIRPWHLLMAKLGVSLVVGIVSMTVLIVFSTFLLDAHWGHPIGVGLLVVAGVLAAISTVTLVVGVAKTPDQAAQAQSIVALVLGALGGSFISMAQSGPIGRMMTKLTPHHWFGEGLVRMSGGQSWTAALPPMAWLIGFALLIGVPGIALAHRTVTP